MNEVFDSWLGLSSEISIRWGMTLLHFLWQGAMIGLLAHVAAGLLRRQNSLVKYWLYTVALLACPLSVAMTFMVVETTAIPDATGKPANGSLDFLDVSYPIPVPIPENSMVSSESAAAASISQMTPLRDGVESVTEADDSAEFSSRWLPVIAWWMTILYVGGVICFLLRLGISLWGGHRLRAGSMPVTNPALFELVRDQARRIGLRFVPVVCCCERIAVPAVIGVLRPMILLPTTLATGLSPEELSAILSHELAHIRRCDLWMNLIQRVIESLLFFHPVVWMLSRRVSAEREICCDDLVVRSGHQKIHYAGALLRMAESCATSRQANVASLAADGDQPILLEYRIERLLNAEASPCLRLSPASLTGLLLLLCTTVAVPGTIGLWAQETEPPVVESTTEPLIAQSATPDKTELLSEPLSEQSLVSSADVVEVKYPHCILNIDDLKSRPLAEAINVFNREALESPVGRTQPPVTEQETREAISKSASEPHLPLWVREQLNEILKTDHLPSNVYFRRFTRFDHEPEMHGVWWVRLVVESSDGPVYSVPVRTHWQYSRPYTQMERKHNAADGLTLLNRVASYYEEPPLELAAAEPSLASAADEFIATIEEAISRNDTNSLKTLSDWTGVSDAIREFAISELQALTQASIHSMVVHPVRLQGKLLTWSAWQYYKPNLPIVGFLEIEYTPKGLFRKKLISLELGLAGNELRLVNYIADGDQVLPKSLGQVSIRGSNEPLADGTFLVTDIVTNPGSLLSAHLSNEEVRQRDLNHKEPIDEAEANVPQTDPTAEHRGVAPGDKNAYAYSPQVKTILGVADRVLTYLQKPDRILTMVVAEHVNLCIPPNGGLYDARIVSFEEMDEILRQEAAKDQFTLNTRWTHDGGPAYSPQKKQRIQRALDLSRDHRRGGFSGDLSGRAAERLDTIQTAADLWPNDAPHIAGMVLDPAGAPVDAADVFTMRNRKSWNESAYIQKGQLRDRLLHNGLRTSDDGRFKIYLEDDDAETVLVAIHATGIACRTLEQFQETGELRLQPWASVRGHQSVSQPGSPRVAISSVPLAQAPGLQLISNDTTIGHDGFFESGFVAPGSVQVKCLTQHRAGPETGFLPEAVTRLELRPGTGAIVSENGHLTIFGHLPIK